MSEKKVSAKALYSRERSGDVMDVSLLFNGEGSQADTSTLLVDGVMAGLSATLIVEMGAEAFNQVDMNTFKSGWAEFLEGLRVHFEAHKHVKEQSETKGWVDEDDFDAKTLLIAPGCVPELGYEGTTLWSDTDTKIAFEMPLDAKNAKMLLEGTRAGIKESLVFLWFFVLIEELGVDDGNKLLALADKLMRTELNQVEGRYRDVSYFEDSLRPWINKLKRLRTEDTDASTRVVVD